MNKNDAKRKSGFFKQLVLLAAVLAFSFLTAELFVRWFIPVRNVGPSFTTYDPVYGKRLKKNFTCHRAALEFSMRFTTNSLGYRGPEPGVPLKGTLLFLGDSMTMGYGVSDGEEYPSLVRNTLAEAFGQEDFPVLNAGMGDNGNGRWVKFLKDDAAQYEPRFVVFQVLENDFPDNVRENLFVLTPEGELIEKPVPPPGWKRKAQLVIEGVPGLANSYLVGLFRQVLRAQLQRSEEAESDGPAVEPGQPEYFETEQFKHESALAFALIEESLRLCRQRGWPTAVIAAKELDGNRMEELQKLCKRLKVPFFHVPGQKSHPDLYYEVDGHWNPPGHVFVAEMLTDWFFKHETFGRPVKR